MPSYIVIIYYLCSMFEFLFDIFAWLTMAACFLCFAIWPVYLVKLIVRCYRDMRYGIGRKH